ncbi:rhodanese-like domain-containing protein [Leptospira noguchii]|uniref:rhodanese-like domain-containing protein n=1 Tax=Leptospira noguchii TaxID=28182 RepID=UPI0002BEA985|nr:rhodanese-like domain-containing protein [Leptospira noguchii]EMI63051.1 rhodanese-like protein [Leptospira noguchii str. Bonito]UOG39649.1 rhodanese-like domain-containing protein [Leptospira noguchii]
MKILYFLLFNFCFCIILIGQENSLIKTKRNPIPNRLIDYKKFQNIVNSSAEEREVKRLTEEDFLKMIQDEEVVLLDARSESRYKLRHIKGAISLPFTEFTKESLSKIIPNMNSKILIYCNNNFTGSPEAFASKAPAASLNLSTFVSLKAYGYKNIYELGPLLSVDSTKLTFEGTEVQ